MRLSEKTKEFGQKFFVINGNKLIKAPYVAENMYAIDDQLVKIYPDNVFTDETKAIEEFKKIRIHRLSESLIETKNAIQRFKKYASEYQEELISIEKELAQLKKK